MRGFKPPACFDARRGLRFLPYFIPAKPAGDGPETHRVTRNAGDSSTNPHRLHLQPYRLSTGNAGCNLSCWGTEWPAYVVRRVEVEVVMALQSVAFNGPLDALAVTPIGQNEVASAAFIVSHPFVRRAESASHAALGLTALKVSHTSILP